MLFAFYDSEFIRGDHIVPNMDEAFPKKKDNGKTEDKESSVSV